MSDDLMAYKKRVQDHINVLVPIFAQASIGDFSHDLKIPKTEDEFTSLYVGIQIMIDVIREKVRGYEEITRQLQERVEEKTALLQSIGDGVVVLNQRGNVTFLNQAGVHLIGWEEKEVLDTSWVARVPLETVEGKRVPSEERPFAVHLYSNVAVPKGVIQHQDTYYYVRKNNSRFPVSITISPVVVDGERIGTILVFRDISREKEVEQLKDDFLSLATHQLRNPLVSMRWTIESLFSSDSEEVSEKIMQKLEHIYENDLHMLSLVNDILNVSRLDQNKLKEHRVPTKITALIQNVVDEEKFEATRKNISFQVEIDPSLEKETYLIDTGLLSHCILNLVSNAVKYSGQGSSVNIGVRPRGSMICVTVTDQGMGIPEQDKPHVFEKFYRGQNVSQSDIPGSGLGLFVVQSLVEYWKGTIEFESAEHKGTTISLCIPLEKTTL